MIIWFAVLIPLLTVVTLVVGFRKKVALAEYLVVFLAPLLLIAGFKIAADYSQISATEYLGGWGYKGRVLRGMEREGVLSASETTQEGLEQFNMAVKHFSSNYLGGKGDRRC